MESAANVALAELDGTLAYFIIALRYAMEVESQTGLPPNPIRELLARTDADVRLVMAGNWSMPAAHDVTFAAKKPPA